MAEGRSLTRAMLVIGIVVLSVSASAVLTLPFRVWYPVTVVLGALVGLALGLRLVPHPAGDGVGGRASWLVPILAGGAAAWFGLTHSENVIVNRDASSYLQTAIAFTTQHGTPLNPGMGRFGDILGIDPERITLSSLAFYQVAWPFDPAVQPQFLPGATSLYSIGYWAGGFTGAVWVGAIFGGLSVLAVGTAGARWFGGHYGVVAAAVTALAFPLVYTARTTFTEPIALFLGICAVIALGEVVRLPRTDDRAARWAVLAGILFVGNQLIRIDALREVLTLYVIALVLWKSGYVGARVLIRVLDAGLILTVLAWITESWLYLVINKDSVFPLLLAVVGVRILLVLLMNDRIRRLSLGPRLRRVLPGALAALTAAVWVFVASRPWWLVSRSGSASEQVAALQRDAGLPVDASRNYEELSLVWTSWWVGWLAVAVCAVASVVLVRAIATRLVRGDRLASWMPAFAIGLVTSLLILLRPGVAPDHPWADRRLVPVVVFVLLTCVGAIAWAVRRAVRRADARVGLPIGAALSAVLIVPVAMGTWPHLTERYSLGEYRGVRSVCAELRGSDVVVVLDPAAAVWTQVVRGTCGKPTVRVATGDYPSAAELGFDMVRIREIVRSAGGSLAVVSSTESQLRELIGPRSRMHHIDFGPVLVEPSTLVVPPRGLAEGAFSRLWWADPE